MATFCNVCGWRNPTAPASGHNAQSCQANSGHWSSHDVRRLYIWIVSIVNAVFGQTPPQPDSCSPGQFVEYFQDGVVLVMLANLAGGILYPVHTAVQGILSDNQMLTNHRNFALFLSRVQQAPLLNHDYTKMINGQNTKQLLASLKALWVYRHRFGWRGLLHSGPLKTAFFVVNYINSNRRTQARRLYQEFEASFDGERKHYYVYLLLDCRHLFPMTFQTFVMATFYVGKGVDGRHFDHGHEAAQHYRPNEVFFNSRKIANIQDIWATGNTMCSVVGFPCSTEKTAFFLEYSMMAAIGLGELSNKIHGNEPRPRRAPQVYEEIGTFGLYQMYEVACSQGVVPLSRKEAQR